MIPNSISLKGVDKFRQPRGRWTGSPTQNVISSADWWLALDPRLEYLRTDVLGNSIISSSSGAVVRLTEPGHILEEYLLASRYTAVFHRLLPEDPTFHVLATNRGGEPIAAEKEIGPGLLLVVPSDGPRELLSEGLRKLLDLRRAVSTDWPLKVEIDALADLRDAETRLRDARRAATDRLVEVELAKQGVLDDPTVRQALRFYEAATAPGTSQPTSLGRLYQTVECVKAHFGTERIMLSELAVTKGTLSRVTQVANDPANQARHVGLGPAAEIEESDMDSAITATHEILHRFMEWCYTAQQTAGR